MMSPWSRTTALHGRVVLGRLVHLRPREVVAGLFVIVLAQTTAAPTARAQLCLGRPGLASRHLSTGLQVSRGEKATAILPRVGTSIGRTFATAGLGRSARSSSSATLLAGELGFQFSRQALVGAHWCATVRASRQNGPAARFAAGEFRVTQEQYRFGWSFGDILGGSLSNPSPYVLVASLSYLTGRSATTSPLGRESERNDGFAAGIGLHKLLSERISVGLSLNGSLAQPAIAARNLSVDVAMNF